MFAGIDGQQNVLLSAQLQRLLCHHGETANAFVFCHQMQPELQKGPTCGFAVLLIALRCSVGDVTLDRLVKMGKHFGITYNGELFSGPFSVGSFSHFIFRWSRVALSISTLVKTLTTFAFRFPPVKLIGCVNLSKNLAKLLQTGVISA
ncbi:hypothetical protein niasHT_014655 [Heterodera trifolii]|uniref:Uncharacterized protein n=1 Tax=Heterodera trifolii TaxID=157864 RepID=A0ABD2LI25_9BILA